jgi:hypothetical protein
MSDRSTPPDWYKHRHYRRQVKVGLAQERQNLEEFESGRLQMAQRSEDGTWQDVTQRFVANQKRIIETFEDALAALENMLN